MAVEAASERRLYDAKFFFGHGPRRFVKVIVRDGLQTRGEFRGDFSPALLMGNFLRRPCFVDFPFRFLSIVPSRRPLKDVAVLPADV